jgi:hypothetical protein
MYIHNCTNKNQKAAESMVNASIVGASSDGYRNVIGLPRCGGPASLWRACLAVAGLPRCGGPFYQLSKEY